MQRVVLVTGVAGGIGYATAELFSQRGWIVVGTDRQQLPDNKSVIHHFLQLDLASPESPRKAFDFIKEKLGRLDALVNNAAVQICKQLLDTTEEDWDLIMAVNLKAPFVCSKLAFPLLKLHGGAIINVSSVHAVATSVGIAAYASSKGALSALTRNSALEFAPDGVRVNAVLPGAIDTAMLHSGLSRGHVEGTNLEELIRGLGKKTVMGRVGRPTEIACAIYFLADREMSSFMTGQSIVVDGGATARLSTE